MTLDAGWHHCYNGLIWSDKNPIRSQRGTFAPGVGAIISKGYMHDKIGEVRKFKGFARATALALSAVVLTSTLIMSGCEATGGVPAFRAKGFLPSTVSGSTSAYSWSGATAIDVVTSAAIGTYANNDLSSECTTLFSGVDRGCMQPPATAYSDSRWFIGFYQNYISAAIPPTSFSAFVNMTDLVTRLFGTTLGPLLNTIDNGAGAGGTTPASARYMRFAKFYNGDVAAVFSSEEGGVRRVYANIYSASANSWGAAVALSTAARDTDDAFDYLLVGSAVLGNRTQFCRPAVATSGDGSAMATWCEADAAGLAVAKYARYAHGAWSAALPLVDLSDAPPAPVEDEATYALPGLHGTYNQFPPASGTLSPSTIQVGDIFSGGIVYDDIGVRGTDTASVTAVASGASQNQFNLVTDAGGTVQICDTLKNMANAMLATKVFNSVSAATVNRTLSQANVSIVVDPACVQGTPSTWRLSMYYNRSLNNLVRNIDAAANTDLNQILPMTVTRDVAGVATVYQLSYNDATAAGTGFYIPATALLGAADGTQIPPHDRTSAVDIAGDGYGNYAFVRTMPASTVSITDISPTGVTDRGRMLVGHEWLTSNWRMRESNTRTRDPAVSFISRVPMCFDGTDTYACSVRHPKVLMSSAGRGLVLFYQSQWDRPTTTSTESPTRLWYATYGTSTGFSSVANILDDDTFCSTSSTANDEAVCETAEYSPAPASAAGTAVDTTKICMNAGEPTALTNALQTDLTNLTHDVPPIAAAMNTSGQAIVAYHKKTLSDLSTSSCSSYVRLQVVTYDPFNGFSSAEALDSETGNTMHAQVAITPNGKMAVVWEEYDPTTRATYVYLRTRASASSSWDSAILVNSSTSMQASQESMMPSVDLNDTGEIIVTFSYSSAATVRRQYVNYYYYH